MRHQILLRKMLVLGCVALLSGCMTAPSTLTDLGTEDGERVVTASRFYIGWFGLSHRRKDEVYQRALEETVDLGRRQNRGDALRDVKLWETTYVGPHVVLAVLPAAVAVAMRDPYLSELIVSGTMLILSGLEIVEYRVTGVPYFREGPD